MNDDAPAGIEVDGDRPAVQWVTELPADWLTPAERLVLLCIACDSYDGRRAVPGNDNLRAWTGLDPGYGQYIVKKLCQPTGKRPAAASPREQPRRPWHRVTLVLLKPADPVGTFTDVKPADPESGTFTDKPADKLCRQTCRHSRHLPCPIPKRRKGGCGGP